MTTSCYSQHKSRLVFQRQLGSIEKHQVTPHPLERIKEVDYLYIQKACNDFHGMHSDKSNQNPPFCWIVTARCIENPGQNLRTLREENCAQRKCTASRDERHQSATYNSSLIDKSHLQKKIIILSWHE
ncbi:hypothetical protein AVEN_112218-1 [Araneus ventricosus]|uniref:Uncharacterized protein n=1 Tax=Araneus ventricosus TaxID=182803 RepID=A0A4Y2Q4R6_ARAVE|nr:hypothetical protein AVEN_112218-1 [Araneus ventricosus]